MSIRYWLYAVAFGGCLIGSAQLRAQVTPNPQIEEQPSGKAGVYHTAVEPFALPVRIIQSEEEAEHDRNREHKSDEYDAAGLNAQERSANAAEIAAAAAENQVLPTYAQVFIGFFGTVGLIVALILSFCSNRTAAAALNLSRETAEKELRAYVMLESSGVKNLADGSKFSAFVMVRNTGQTPARDVRSVIGLCLNVYPPPDDMIFEIDNSYAFSRSMLGPGGAQIVSSEPFPDRKSEPIDAATYIALKAGKQAIYLIGEVRYYDAFSKCERVTTARLFCTGDNIDGTEGSFSMLDGGNDYT